MKKTIINEKNASKSLEEDIKFREYLAEELKKYEVNSLERNQIAHTRRIPTTIKLIKVEVNTWNKLKSLKKGNQTFDDIIGGLLGEKTKSIGNQNINAIKYARKKGFFTKSHKMGEIGCEYEYNDIKNNIYDFVLDLKIKKIFFGKRMYDPTEFFGTDNEHKHFSPSFLVLYYHAVIEAIYKDLKRLLSINEKNRYDDIVVWKKFYSDYNLSQESFINDIETPLRLSDEEKPSEEWQKRIDGSIFQRKKVGVQK